MAQFLRILLSLLLGAVSILSYILRGYSHDLPDSRQLTNYEPSPSVTSPLVFTLVTAACEYTTEKRVVTPLAVLPLQFPKAFLSLQ